ncbi:hypothetical protein Syun_017017 [Stephania yunnanensis]|uniref:Uncharacterized protein n=1 Tax=Stephania yunnanensis TaxID=152371 RepID=A0AAP0J7Q8_9MAGN
MAHIKKTKVGKGVTHRERYIALGIFTTNNLIVHFDEAEYHEKNFSEDSSFMDKLAICKKLIDPKSLTVTLKDGQDFLFMIEEHKSVKNIDIYLDKDETSQPLPFKIAQDNPNLGSYIPIIPKVINVKISGDLKHNKKVIVKGDVIDGSEKDSIELQISKKAIGYYLVAKYTLVTADGKIGVSVYVIYDSYVEHSEPRNVWGKNVNKAIAKLDPGEKYPIQFKGGYRVMPNQQYWSRHIGKVARDPTECFYNSDIEAYKDATIKHVGSLWEMWRLKLNVDYARPCKSCEEAVRNVLEDMDLHDWEEKDGRLPTQDEMFFLTRQKGGHLVEQAAKDKYDEIRKTIQSNPSLTDIEIVEKCFGPQRHGHMFGYGDEIKRKHLEESNSFYVKELEARLIKKDEENCKLQKSIESTNNRLDDIEKERGKPSSVAPSTSNEESNQVSLHLRTRRKSTTHRIHGFEEEEESGKNGFSLFDAVIMAGVMCLLKRWRSPRVAIWLWWEGFGHIEEALRIVTMGFEGSAEIRRNDGPGTGARAQRSRTRLGDPQLGRRLAGDSRWFVFVFSFLFQFVQFSSLPFSLLNNFLVVSNCALNMACEILQLELGNMNLRLFGSPGKFYGQAQAHVVVYEGKIREKPSSKEEARQLIKGSWLVGVLYEVKNGSNSVSDPSLISNGSETEIIRNGIYSVSNQKRN